MSSTRSFNIVSDPVIDAAWQEVNAVASSGKLGILMEQFGEDQPAIAEFLAEAAEGWGEDAADLAYHSTLVIWRSIAKQNDAPPAPVRAEVLFRKYEDTTDWIESEQGDAILFQKKMADLNTFAQPNLMRYVMEAVFESSEDGLELDAAEQAEVFMLLKTVVDSL